MPLRQCNCEGCELKTLFFENVSNLEIESMCNRKEEKTYLKGEFIYREGELIQDFTYLKKGLIKMFKGNNTEKEQIICFAGPMDFVSLMSIFSETQYKYSVVALEDSVTCSMKLNEVKALANKNGLFAMSLAEKINKVSDTIIISMLEVKQKRLFGRVAYILLYFSNVIYKNTIFELPVSRKEIGEFIGMTTENVIRTLSDLRKDKIIKINGKLIEITDIERLKKICELS
jgi:CRP-like cAMP-binding protein